MTILIILGSPNTADGKLSPTAIARAERALFEYQNEKNAKFLLTGGWGTHFNTAPLSHAQYLAEWLLSQDVPADVILPLAESSNTVADAKLVSRILNQLEIDTSNPLKIFTSDYHVPRAQLIFEHFFPPSRLTFISTDSGLTPDEKARHKQHEKIRIDEIVGQGGVIVNGVLLKRIE